MDTPADSSALHCAEAHDYIREEPLAVLAIAVATGFVLGGGITPRIGRAMLTMAGRTAFAALWPVLIAELITEGRTDYKKRDSAKLRGGRHDNGRTDFQESR